MADAYRPRTVYIFPNFLFSKQGAGNVFEKKKQQKNAFAIPFQSKIHPKESA